jgi:hypothetical protein
MTVHRCALVDAFVARARSTGAAILHQKLDGNHPLWRRGGGGGGVFVPLECRAVILCTGIPINAGCRGVGGSLACAVLLMAAF